MSASLSKYQLYYQMKREAFSNLPELNVFFNSRTHQQAWRYLVSGIKAGEPYLLVVGDYGMGKTLLCMMLVRMLKQRAYTCCAYIPDPHTDYAEMLGEIALALGLDASSCNAVALHAMLNRHFRERVRQEVCYIVIDDAHELDSAVFERLRSLTNINNNGRFPFRLVLFAHTVVLDMLREPPLIALGQRIRSRCLLTPLDLEEVREYIYYRLYKSGGFRAPLFTDDAIQEVYFVSKGVPRIINTLAHTCLIMGAEQGLDIISHGVVVAAAQAIGTTPVEQRPQIHVTQQTIVGEKPQEDKTTEEEDAIYGKKGSPARREKPLIPDSQRQHVAEQSRPLFLPAVLFALMVMVIIAAGGWEYYRLKQTRDAAEQPRPHQEEQKGIPRNSDNATRAIVPSATVSDASRNLSSSGADMPSVSGETLSKLSDPQRSTSEQGKAQTVTSLQPSAPTNLNGVVELGQQKEPESTTICTYVISLPPQKSVITVDLTTRRAVLWQHEENRMVAKDEGDTTWSWEDGLFLAGVDPRQGDFLFRQMNFMKGAAEKTLPIKRWRDGRRVSERELVPVLVLSSSPKLDEKASEKARELPRTVAAWAEAWRRKDVDRMMSFYSDIVTLWDTDKNKPFVFTKEEMTKRRSEVFAKCGTITVDLSEPVCVVDPRNSDFGIAVMSQQYQSQTYADEGEKALFFRMEQDATGASRQWKIVGQLWVPWKITQLKR